MKKTILFTSIPLVILGGLCGFWFGQKGAHLMHRNQDSTVKTVMIFENMDFCERYRMIYNSSVDWDELGKTYSTKVTWKPYDSIFKSTTWCEEK